MRRFNGPLAASPPQWQDQFTALWNDSAAPARLAEQGHAAAAREFSTTLTARQWIRYLAQSFTPG